MGKLVNVILPDGTLKAIPEEQANALAGDGVRRESTSEAASRTTAAYNDENTSALRATAEGAVDTATFGAYGALVNATDPEQSRRMKITAEANPGYRALGTVAGAIVPVGAGAVAAKAGAAVGKGGGLAARAAGLATEGAVQGVAAELSAANISTDGITIEGLASAVGISAALNVGIGLAAQSLMKAGKAVSQAVELDWAPAAVKNKTPLADLTKARTKAEQALAAEELAPQLEAVAAAKRAKANELRDAGQVAAANRLEGQAVKAETAAMNRAQKAEADAVKRAETAATKAQEKAEKLQATLELKTATKEARDLAEQEAQAALSEAAAAKADVISAKKATEAWAKADKASDKLMLTTSKRGARQAAEKEAEDALVEAAIARHKAIDAKMVMRDELRGAREVFDNSNAYENFRTSYESGQSARRANNQRLAKETEAWNAFASEKGLTSTLGEYEKLAAEVRAQMQKTRAVGPGAKVKLAQGAEAEAKAARLTEKALLSEGGTEANLLSAQARTQGAKAVEVTASNAQTVAELGPVLENLADVSKEARSALRAGDLESAIMAVEAGNKRLAGFPVRLKLPQLPARPTGEILAEGPKLPKRLLGLGAKNPDGIAAVADAMDDMSKAELNKLAEEIGLAPNGTHAETIGAVYKALREGYYLPLQKMERTVVPPAPKSGAIGKAGRRAEQAVSDAALQEAADKATRLAEQAAAEAKVAAEAVPKLDSVAKAGRRAAERAKDEALEKAAKKAAEKAEALAEEAERARGAVSRPTEAPARAGVVDDATEADWALARAEAALAEKTAALKVTSALDEAKWDVASTTIAEQRATAGIMETAIEEGTDLFAEQVASGGAGKGKHHPTGLIDRAMLWSRMGAARSAARVADIGGYKGAFLRTMAGSSVGYALDGKRGAIEGAIAMNAMGAKGRLRAQTRQAVNRFERSVGLTLKLLGPATGGLANRVFGGRDEETDEAKLALARINEINEAVVQGPDALYHLVKGVMGASGDMALMLHQQWMGTLKYLSMVAPKDPGINRTMGGSAWVPSPIKVDKFAHQYEATMNPMGYLARVMAGDGHVAGVEALAQNWPAALQEAQAEVLARGWENLSAEETRGFSQLFRTPLSGMQHPSVVLAIQSQFIPRAEAGGGGGASPPTGNPTGRPPAVQSQVAGANVAGHIS